MPLFVLILVAVTAGCLACLAAWRYPRAEVGSPAPALAAGRAAGDRAASHSGRRRFLAARLDPAAATGLALTLALIVTIAGGVMFGVLAYLVRTNAHLNRIDRSVAVWGHDHATALSTHGLNVVTQFGATLTAIFVCIVLAVIETIRTRSPWIVPFLVVLMVGNEILFTTIKHLANRARPTFNPAAATLGPAFPSGHSATAAALYAGAALLLARRRGHVVRAVLSGFAVALAVAVASSRVLLDVHWLFDVIAGLILGWVWFMISSVAFGGRLLKFGAPAQVAVDSAKRATPSRARAPVSDH
jgi:membrane-associated phospholipid phosphatase